MACNCGADRRNVTNRIHLYAVVGNLSLTNTPNLIPDSDKFLTFDEAKAALTDEKPFVVRIVGGGVSL